MLRWIVGRLQSIDLWGHTWYPASRITEWLFRFCDWLDADFVDWLGDGGLQWYIHRKLHRPYQSLQVEECPTCKLFVR